MKKRRYFQVFYWRILANNKGWGHGSLAHHGTHPSEEEMQTYLESNNPKGNSFVITGIHEFKDEEDFNAWNNIKED